MLTHLSSERFENLIADFHGSDKWKFKCMSPTLVVFHMEEHLFAKGFRDAYDPLKNEFPEIKTYEVIQNEDPMIAKAYGIGHFPATLFIPLHGEAKIVEGYLSPQEVVEDVKKYLLNA